MRTPIQKCSSFGGSRVAFNSHSETKLIRHKTHVYKRIQKIMFSKIATIPQLSRIRKNGRTALQRLVQVVESSMTYVY